MGFIEGVDEIRAAAKISPAEISGVFHGTTVATNAILERKYDLLGLIVTGGYREVLNPIPPSGACAYSGAYERPGAYQVEASRPGYQPAAAGPVTVEMSRGDCPHVITQRVTLMLRPGV